MVRAPAALVILAVLAAGSLTTGLKAQSAATSPFPSILQTLNGPLSDLGDLSAIAAGCRRLAADIAWVQTLQYYGTHVHTGEDEHGHHHIDMEAEASGTAYPLFLAHCQRVTSIDPHFTFAYYYGAGVLGWNLNRVAEAEALIRQGIRDNPKEWRLTQYLAAIAYQKTKDPSKLIEFLASFVELPDCPNLLRALLANIYKKRERYVDAMKVWFRVLDTKDPEYMSRAKEQIEALAPLAGIQMPRS